MSPRMGGYVPADHKTRHQDDGRDEISIASLDGTPAELTTHAALAIAHGTVDDIADQTDIATHAADADAHHALNKGAAVYNDASQVIANATWTVLAFNSEIFDTDTIHDPTTNNSRLTCKTAGTYIVIFNASFPTNATGFRGCSLRKNGAGNYGANYVVAVNGDATRFCLSQLLVLAVNDYLELIVYQTSGGNLSLDAGTTTWPNFMMVRIA